MDKRVDNGTMEVAISLGAVAVGAAAAAVAGSAGGPVAGVIGAMAGAVAGAMAGRWIGRTIVRPPRARRRTLSQLLNVDTQVQRNLE